MTNLFIIVLVIAAIVWWAWKVADYYSQSHPIETNCTGDCNQGRCCTCCGDMPEDNEFWPFPRSKP